MASKTNPRMKARLTRKRRVRKKIRGTDAKPRLCVYKSARYIYAQIISDDSGRVLAATSSKSVVAKDKSASCVESAKEVGKAIAELAKGANVEAVVFDRNGYLYHGRVAAVAEGAREGGLQF